MAARRKTQDQADAAAPPPKGVGSAEKESILRMLQVILGSSRQGGR